jgi:hypothetical protein
MSAPRPEDLAKAGTEHAHQSALFCWAALPDIQEKYPALRWMFAIPNGGERNPKVAAQMKAEGVKSGVLDIFLPVPKGQYHGLFIEMKVGKNKPSDNQTLFATHATCMGYRCALCYSWEAARDKIAEYLQLP